MNKKYTLILLILFFVSCNTNKSVIQTTLKKSKSKTYSEKYDKKSSRNNNSDSQILEASTRVKVTNEMILAYIEKYKKTARIDMKKYGIPASITLGQAILESGSGTAPLAQYGNNHFGIKCHKDWQGATVRYDDDTVGECFRKYDNPYDSFRDHSVFLASGTRYSQLFELDKTNYKDWAKGLRQAGYATDVQYPAKLITLIEKFQLYKYDDNETSENDYSKNNEIKQESNNSDEYTVVQGDTLYSISKKLNLTVEELKEKNNFTENSISIGQKLKIN